MLCQNRSSCAANISRKIHLLRRGEEELVIPTFAEIRTEEMTEVKDRSQVESNNDKMFFSELASRYSSVLKNLSGWQVKVMANGLIFFDLVFGNDGASVRKSIYVFKPNRRNAGVCALIKSNGKPIGHEIIVKWSELDDLIKAVFDDTIVADPKAVIAECISLLKSVEVENKNHKTTIEIVVDQLVNIISLSHHYGVDTMLASIFWRNVSPAAYDAMKIFLILPSKQHLNSLSSNLDSLNTSKYLSLVNAKCSEMEKLVIIQVDEFALLDQIIYKSGKIHGYEERPDGTNSDKIAKRGQAFFMTSLFGQVRELVKFMPIANQTKEELAAVALDVVKTVQDAGFTVLIFLYDGANLNRGAMHVLTSVEG